MLVHNSRAAPLPPHLPATLPHCNLASLTAMWSSRAPREVGSHAPWAITIVITPQSSHLNITTTCGFLRAPHAAHAQTIFNDYPCEDSKDEAFRASVRCDVAQVPWRLRCWAVPRHLATRRLSQPSVRCPLLFCALPPRHLPMRACLRMQRECRYMNLATRRLSQPSALCPSVRALRSGLCLRRLARRPCGGPRG